MANPYYRITGIKTGKGPDGQLPLRYEIDALYQSKDPSHKRQVDLMLLALQKFQQMDVTDELSYFQIAGIHGCPYISWNEKLCPQIPTDGYCNHNSTLFSTWHRPYLGLLEQRLHEIMVDIAQQYPTSERDAYEKAASTWRLPYWDWAQLKERASGLVYDVPLLVKPPTIEVHGPTGPTKLNPNPLSRFLVPGGKAFGDLGPYSVNGVKPEGSDILYPFNIAKSTSRHSPQFVKGDEKITQAWVDGVVNDEAITRALQANTEGPIKNIHITLGEWVYRILHNPLFDKYTTTLMNVGGKPSPQGNNMSLEGVHNSIHDYTGGDNGHMGWIIVSAFDPIFWLHHTNIDRLFALWQTLYPDAWFTDKSQQLVDPGSYYVAAGSTPSPQTPLHPFRDGEAKLYTSDSIRDWLKFNYSYPELQPWLDKYKVDGKFNQRLYYDDVVTQMAKLYGPSTSVFDGLRPHTLLENSTGEKIVHPDYLVDIVYSRYENGGNPYRIYIFLGLPTDDQSDKDPARWKSSKRLLGTIYTFGNPLATAPDNSGQGRCGNCESQSEHKFLSTGQIPLTSALIQHIENNQISLDSLDQQTVSRYLQHSSTGIVSWGATTTNGIQIPQDQLPSLKVSVLAGKATRYELDSKLSKFHDYALDHIVAHVG